MWDLLQFKKLDRYLLKEFTFPFLFGVIVLSAIAAGGSILPTVMSLAERYHFTFGVSAYSFILRMPEAIKVTFLASALLSVLLSFGRLSNDSEITAFRACGLSLFQLLKPVLIFGVGVALLSFGWNEFVLPRANYEKEALTNRVSQQMQDKPPLEEKVNLNTFEDGFLKRLVYANKLEKDIMKEVSVIEYDQGEFSRIIFSKEAQWQNGGGWLFKDGTMYQFSGDKKSAFVMKFKKEVVNLKAQPRDISHYEKNPNDMDVFELRWFIHKELNAGKNVTGLQFLWHQRFALPFAAVVFVILGMGLGVGHIRRPSGMGIAITLMMIAVYYILNSTFDSVTRQGILSPFLGAWLANGVLLAYGIHLLREKSMSFK